MKCPFCGEPMTDGIIQSPQEINWHSGGRKRIVNAAWLYSDSLVLSERSFWRGSAVRAARCGLCRKIVIDYSDPASDLNHL